jgi:hypothetical protein
MTADTLDRLHAVQAVAEVERDELLKRRKSLAADALTGSVEARARLEATSLELAAVEERLDLLELAGVKLAEDERQAAEDEAAVERARLEGEAARLEAELGKAITTAQQAAIRAGEAAAAGVAIGDELASVRGQLGQHVGRPVTATLSDLLQVRLRDQCPRLSFDPVRNYARLQLLEEYPIREPLARPATTCTICSHESLGAIEEALTAGESLCAIAARFSISRSALSRHGQHTVA